MGRGKRKLPPGVRPSLFERNLLIKEYERFGRYAKPDTETRDILDEELGDKTLTEELYAMRREE